MTKHLFTAEVLEHCRLRPQIYKLVFAAHLAAEFRPGQFLQLRIGDGADPLLRRPFSICDVDAAVGTVTLVYRAVGRGTELLSAAKPGDLLDVLGPLGKGFSLQGSKPLLVGGGMGLAPLVYLAKELAGTPEVLMGGRTADELFWQEIFAAVCAKVHITTDDGSLGQQGTVLELLPELLSTGRYDIIYTCGPQPMMESVAAAAAQAGIPCQVSLEKRMACGLGACLSCTCEGSDGKRRKVCTEGPVFWAEEVFNC